MASLTTLPPEILSLICDGLTLRQILKIRLISRSHDEKFRDSMRREVFERLRVEFTSSNVKRLAELGEEVGGYVRHITFVGEGKVKTRAVVKLLGGLSGLKEVDLGGLGAGVNVVIKALHVSETLESVVYNSSAGIMDLTFPSTLGNLKKLEMGLKIPYTHASRPFEKKLWGWIASLPLTELKLVNTAEISCDPDQTTWPVRRHGGYLPKHFSPLSHLKKIILGGIYLTLRDMKLLIPSPGDMEKVEFGGCQMVDPRVEWVGVIEYLDGIDVKLGLAGYFRGIAGYELPDLVTHPDGDCEVTLQSPDGEYKFFKNVRLAVKNSGDTGFWESLTDGKYDSPRVVRWKRLRMLGDRYDLEMKKLGGFAVYDYEAAGRLERKFLRDVEMLEDGGF
ncbi:hypothetical protein TWF481_000350 [Arthrobotrys musiformis]|uniref:F-box domain-containing protein n=1 Tax=Arthrobotrys musiformis TaxID=47236 RepID=A0AAV9WMP8_9PEZI